MYSKVDSKLDFVERELAVQEFWKEKDIFRKSIEARAGREIFTFFEGPPTANGKPHVGHIITRVVKDLIPRYRTMKGYQVLRKAGWDTHGLPVELEVEKMLGISGKPQIESYGVEPFIQKCKESVWKYESEWRSISERVGFWADMDEPYVTYHNSYIESAWWAIKSIWEKGLLYKGHKVVPYCPRCGTPLSSHEVSQGYEEVCEESVIVRFKVKSTDNSYFLAWTTTPWTLPSNVALVVNAKESYAKVKCGGDIYILAEALCEKVFDQPYEIMETVTGKELEGAEYEPLFNFVPYDKKGHYICCDDYVSLSDGTGIVHTAPAFGEDDARIGRIYDLPFVQLVDEQGKFVNEVDLWAGFFVKDADPLIVKHLRETNKLFKAEDYTHSYPFCWRCHTALLYYARTTWFIEMTKVRDKLVANNNTVNWLPDNVKHGRFGNFLENVVDWGLSRERYWGTPLPLWECGCTYVHAIGSVEELRSMAISEVSADIELHKPYIDEVKIKCPKCSAAMVRVPEVIDCWFDSGAMPFAQWHYPFENKEMFEKQFPADFISEAVDQTRGWFYSLMAISTLLFDRSSYKNVIVLGHVLDKDGQKMSKHKGNVVDPWEVLNSQGADAVRWYFMVNAAPWLPSRFYEEAVVEAGRKFMGTFWNTYAFYVLYANIDGFNPTGYELDIKKCPPLDRWILSKLHSLIATVDNHLENYRLTEPARAMNDFIDQVSNWYVRRSRERFWAADMPQDKINAYLTLHTVLETLTRLAAPFIPFMTEEIYQNIVRSINQNAPESVHLCDFPVSNSQWVDKDLEENMDKVLDIVVLGRAARNNAAIKNRQPIATMYVQTLPLWESYTEIIKEELNIKDIQFKDELNEFLTYTFKPQLRTLGPKYGKLVPKIGEELKKVDGNAFMEQIKQGTASLEVDGITITLKEEDVLYEQTDRENYFFVTDRGSTVVIDAKLTPELIEEGFVREIISKVQTMRKEAGFEVLDRINISYQSGKVITDVFTKHAEIIAAETLADQLTANTIAGYEKEWNINGETAKIIVAKI